MEQFKIMKNDSILINTARGGLVNEEDLVVALKEGLIGGAGFDVLTKEPPKDGNPLLNLNCQLYFNATRCLGLRRGSAVSADQLIDNVELFVQGNPQHLVV